MLDCTGTPQLHPMDSAEYAGICVEAKVASLQERDRELNNVHAANKADGTARLSVFDVKSHKSMSLKLQGACSIA